MTNMQAAFDRLRAASRADAAPDARARRRHLETLADLIRVNGDAFAKAICEDFGGRSPDETRMLELAPLLRGIRHARRHVA